MSLTAGDRLGRFELIGPLGRGGMGEVWRARDPRLSREVAVKVLPEQLARDPEWVARFEREARALAALSHPNVAQIYEIGEASVSDEGDEPLRFLVMELVSGQTLRDRLKEGPLPVELAVEVGSQVARGLAAAHSRGVIHRDLKPANIMLGTDGIAKVLDFGLARIEPLKDAPSDTEITLAVSRPGTVLGTAAYMAPEQMRGLECGPACDVWAFGCCLAEMLSGKRLFVGATIPEIASKVLGGAVNVTALPAKLPAELRQLVVGCLREDAGDRPAMEAIVQRLGGTAALATRSRFRLLPVLGGLVATVALVFAVVLATRQRPPAAPTPRASPLLRVAVEGPGVAAEGVAGRAAAAIAASLTGRPGLELARTGAELRLEWGIDTSSEPARLRGQLIDVDSSSTLEALGYELPSSDDEASLETVADRVADRVERAGVIHELDRSDRLHGFLARRADSLAVVRSFQQGVALYGRRRLTEAREAFDEALASEPDFWPATVYLAMIDGSTSRFDAGREKLAEVRVRLPRPDAVEAAVLEVAQALLEDDRHRLSEALQRARELFPESGELTYRAAWSYRQLGEPEKAVPLLEGLVKREWQPDWSPTWVQLAYCQVLSGREEEGLATALDGERRFPRNYNLSYVVAVAHALAGRPDAAREAIGRAIRKRTDFSASDAMAIHQVAAYWCGQVGWQEERRRQLQLWLDEIDRRLVSSPDDADLLGRRAEALAGLGRFGEARELLEPLAVDSSDPYALIALARAVAGTGNAAAARQPLDRAGAIWRAGDAPALGVLAYNIACAWAVIGDRSEALAWLGRAADQYGFDRVDLTLDPDLETLRRDGLLAPFLRR